MAPDENKFKTMQFMRCKKCGNVYAASVSGTVECPECSSGDAVRYRPDGKEGGETAEEEETRG
jgi:predicted Zn-ribbon and HTH transcriptional regulator